MIDALALIIVGLMGLACTAASYVRERRAGKPRHRGTLKW